MGRYRSIQSTLIEAALKGITDNQTVTAYKKDCKSDDSRSPAAQYVKGLSQKMAACNE